MAKPLRSSYWSLTVHIIHLGNRSNHGHNRHLGHHCLTINKSPSAILAALVYIDCDFGCLIQCTVNLAFRSHFSRAGQSALKDTFTHANLDHRCLGTGRLSGLPFMSSSFNARSAEPLADICMPRGSQCCVALIVPLTIVSGL